MSAETINKKSLSERDICTKYITPAIVGSYWQQRQIREEVSFTKGRVIVRGKMIARGKIKRADYILYYKPNIPIAIIEAKDNVHSVGAGMQQALEYAETLDIPFVFSSNGDAFLEHDRTKTAGTVEREFPLEQFPTPQELWNRYKTYKVLSEEEEQIIVQDYYIDPKGKEPRYFQRVAINRTVEAIAKGQKRLLLVMATGTGKTYTAFQIIWRLWKSRKKKRILFLADRNILVDQTKNNDFKPFGGAMTKIVNRKVDKSYEIYLAIYQGVTGEEEWKNIYHQFSPDFFDLIVVDECHRGSAKEDSAWREVLEYFTSATQIGLTATPKETKDVSNIHYFGQPIYTYSLRQGISDGFLAPYKVVRIATNVDALGWRPTEGQQDKYGYEVEDRIYNSKDFDRNLVIDERTQLVARKVTEYLKATDRFAKTIIFCVDIDHAERMRQAMVNENVDLANENHKYIMQITGDSPEGKLELDNFINPREAFPVIATTSKLLTTGVDAQTCRLIVLDTNINSMTEFKQIIGRGTRINEEYDKYYFTIMDFRRATELFADSQFDGEPVQIYEPKDDESPVPPDINEDDEIDTDDVIIDNSETDGSSSGGDDFGSDGIGADHPRKYYVNNVPVSVIHQRVQYLGADGKLITESLWDYTRKNIQREYASLDEFLRRWKSAEKKQVIIDELAEQGVLFSELNELVGKALDPFDLICHVTFDQPPLTRRERADNVRKRNYFTKYGDKARAVLEALLDKYADTGITDIESLNILDVRPFDQIGTKIEIVKAFGGKQKYLQALQELENEIYTA
jgi:Type I site-specific restriction-modification system, R (restriction) subunit and related helicases